MFKPFLLLSHTHTHACAAATGEAFYPLALSYVREMCIIPVMYRELLMEHTKDRAPLTGRDSFEVQTSKQSWIVAPNYGSRR